MRSTWFWPGLTAAVSVGIGVGGKLAIGSVYHKVEAIQLIETLASAGLYLGSAIATASATILALMLTLLGLTRRSDSDFDFEVYRQIASVSNLATYSLLGSLLLLVVLVLPIGEFEEVPANWFPTLYNILFGMIIGISSLLAATVVMLLLTVRRVVAGITPGDDL